MPLPAGAFVQAGRIARTATGAASYGDDDRDLLVELAGLVSPLNFSFFFARIVFRPLHSSLQEARRLG
jgi:hypothetical protein